MATTAYPTRTFASDVSHLLDVIVKKEERGKKRRMKTKMIKTGKKESAKQSGSNNCLNLLFIGLRRSIPFLSRILWILSQNK